MDNFRDSYFQVDWDLTSKRLKGTYWGKQYDTGRGFAVTVINGGQVVAPTNEVLRLKWEKPDKTTGYVNATIVNGKFIIENIDQMFTVQGSVRADFELSVGGKFVASITFYVNVEKAVAVDAIESSSDFTALQDALADVDGVKSQLENIMTLPNAVYVSFPPHTPPENPVDNLLWFQVESPESPEIIIPTDYFFRYDASALDLEDNAKVSAWNDLSLNGNDLIQANPETQPTFLETGLNGKPTVKFNSSFMNKEGFALGNLESFSLFIVAEFDTHASSSTLIHVGMEGSPPTPEGIALSLRFSGSAQGLQTGISGSQQPTTHMAGDPFYIYNSRWDKGNISANRYGGESGTYVTPIKTLATHNALRIGAALSGAEQTNFRLSELIYFPRKLSDAEKISVEDYLANKWGVL